MQLPLVTQMIQILTQKKVVMEKEITLHLSLLVEELSEHTEVESMGIREESDTDDEGTKELQESYNSLLEKIGEYARMAKAAIRKMKKAEQDYKSILVSRGVRDAVRCGFGPFLAPHFAVRFS